jgi:hypothetical protein
MYTIDKKRNKSWLSSLTPPTLATSETCAYPYPIYIELSIPLTTFANPKPKSCAFHIASSSQLVGGVCGERGEERRGRGERERRAERERESERGEEREREGGGGGA